MDRQTDRQTDGQTETDETAMGSLLPPMTANSFMEDYEEAALRMVAYKPTCWLFHMDGKFVIWPHVLEVQNDFLNHLNNIHPNIQFTMETESNAHLPFLDIYVQRI